MNRFTRLLALLAPLVPMAAGCYNVDKIKNGGLACAPNYVCPDGYGCRNGRCYENGTDGGSSTGSDGGAGVLCPAPFGPVAGCLRSVDPGSTCDPVCQTDCSCSERCHLNSAKFTCKGYSGTTYLSDYEACQAGSAATDQCKPGSICLREVDVNACGAHCYRFCRQDSDCPAGSRCNVQITDGKTVISDKVHTCSPPAVVCSPIGSAEGLKCAATPGFACYSFGPSDPDLTTCECAGTIQPGQACNQPHSCTPGYECVGSVCKKLCLLQAAATGVGCGTGKCVSVFGSKRFGTCQ